MEIAQQISDLIEPFSPDTIAAKPRHELVTSQSDLFAQARDFLDSPIGAAHLTLKGKCHDQIT